MRLNLCLILQVRKGSRVGLFGQDLLYPDYPENMNTDLEVELTRIKRRFLLYMSTDF